MTSMLSLQIEYRGEKKYSDQYGMTQTLIDPHKDKYVPPPETSLYIDGLVPSTIYTFTISAKYSDGWGPTISFGVETSIDG